MKNPRDIRSVTNDWSNLSTAYNATRRGYPDELYRYLMSLIKTAGLMTLDLGCGTGISTRELRMHGLDVVGADRDESMIAVAKDVSKEIRYVRATVAELPFQEGSFDVVTAFTAFHWFDDDASVESIKNVLKPGGLFFAALKENREDVRTAKITKEYHTILKKYVGKDYNSAAKYEPYRTLKRHTFRDIQEKLFPVDEFYTIEDALTLIQSLSFWNLVLEEYRPKMLTELQRMYERNLIEGKVLRTRVIKTVTGYR